MTVVLKFQDRTFTAEEIIPLLANYQLLPQLFREIILDQSIASIECTPEELSLACQTFYIQNQLTTETARQSWLEQRNMTQEQLSAQVARGLRIEKFKLATFSHKLESYFLSRKAQLDRVIYSLIRTKDPGIAQELYFRIQAGEQSFTELAGEYSQGQEAQTGGLIGPVEMSTPHPTLGRLLAMSQPGQLWPPTRVEDWLVIVRLEKFIPAQLDEPMRQRLLNELFNAWLSEQIKQVAIVRS